MTKTGSSRFSQIKKAIVIVGAQRSGTTLLRTILDQHPDLISHPNEPQFILEISEQFGPNITDVQAATDYLAQHRYRAESVTPAAVYAAFENHNALSLQEFVYRYLSLWLNGTAATNRPVLKHPRLVFHLDLVSALFPEATIIHVVRDPRGTTASQIARWPHLSVWECGMSWKTAVRAARQWGELHPQQYVETQFEALLQTPEDSVAALCRQLNLNYQEGMLTFREETRYFAPHSLPQSVTLTAVDPTRLNLWQDRLSVSDVWLVEKCCHEEMSWWGYKLNASPSSPGSTYARYFWERSIYQLKETGRRLANFRKQ